MKLSDLKPSEHNPRTITKKQLARLKKSIEEFGDLSGIIFNRRTGNIIGGHQRIKVMPPDAEIVREDLPEASPAGTVSTGTINICGETFTYREVEWDLDRERMANIAANKHGGDWDDEKLAALLAELSQLPDFDIDIIGFESAEMEALIDMVVEDEFDAEKEYEKISEPATRRGDIYVLGSHRLMCGDSASPGDVNTLMDGQKARLVFTDPPYNVDYKSPSNLSYDSTKFGGTGGKIFNDNLSDEDCVSFFTAVLKNLYANTTDDAAIYWWYASRNQHLNIEAFRAAKWHMSQIIVWLKNSMIFSRGQDYHRQYEPCMVGWKKGKKHYSNKNITNYKDVFNLDFDDFVELLDVWYEKRDVTANYIHPTQKPVRLAERGLKKHSEAGDVVIDLFGGSGSTLMACEQMKRQARLMEMDPKYCDVIVTRYVKYTGVSEIVLNGQPMRWEPK
ncbi:MAG: DNA modification methylase [Deltaproteobacteria bacterium]|nr:DNA modification methylase [Deltaproteobacteria bacterium]MCL4873844.1 DNA modification methylase [bacterium]